MKQSILLSFFLFTQLWLQAQSLTLPELLNLTSSSTERFIKTIGKKGYQAASYDKAAARVFNPNDSISSRYMVKRIQSNLSILQLEKLTAQEYEQFRQSMLLEGFKPNTVPAKVYTERFQKNEITVTASAEIDLEEGKRWYNVSVEKRKLPRLKEVRFAEDLLSFDAHQHLELIFGRQNVIKDRYRQEDGTTVACSVIYPNSSREAAFLWQDAANFCRLHSLRIGGNLYTSGALRYSSHVAQNQWVSRQGIYATMTLNELQTRNQQSINFYGWGGGSRGSLCTGNKGAIDFTQIDLNLSCLNCNDDLYYGKRKLDSRTSIEDGRRIFVSTMIFYPPVAEHAE